MIGPPSTYYDPHPRDTLQNQQQDESRYQQWIDAHQNSYSQQSQQPFTNPQFQFSFANAARLYTDAETFDDTHFNQSMFSYYTMPQQQDYSTQQHQSPSYQTPTRHEFDLPPQTRSNSASASPDPFIPKPNSSTTPTPSSNKKGGKAGASVKRVAKGPPASASRGAAKRKRTNKRPAEEDVSDFDSDEDDLGGGISVGMGGLGVDSTHGQKTSRL
jgi:hypothetical protein